MVKLTTAKIIGIALLTFGFMVIAIPDLAYSLSGGLIGAITGGYHQVDGDVTRIVLNSDTVKAGAPLSFYFGRNMGSGSTYQALGQVQYEYYGIYLEKDGEEYRLNEFTVGDAFFCTDGGMCANGTGNTSPSMLWENRKKEIKIPFATFSNNEVWGQAELIIKKGGARKGRETRWIEYKGREGCKTDASREHNINNEQYPGCCPLDKPYFYAYRDSAYRLLWGCTNLSEQLRKEIWIDHEACQLRSGTLMASETFAAGKTVDIDDFRFPVKAFCSTAPILVTEGDKVVEQKIGEYETIKKSHVTIPAGQTWTFFYVFDVTSDVAVVCGDENAIYNPENKKCEIMPGIVHVCSEGIFDPVRGTCTVQPNVDIVCELGFYDTEKDKCVYIPPVEEAEAIVPEEATVIVEDDGTKRFEFEAEDDPVCEIGSYNEETGTCDKDPRVELGRIELEAQKVGIGSVAGIPVERILVGGIIMVIGGILWFRE